MQGANELSVVGVKAAAVVPLSLVWVWIQAQQSGDWVHYAQALGIPAAILAAMGIFYVKVRYPDVQKATEQERLDQLERERLEREDRKTQWRAHHALQRELLDLLRSERGLPPVQHLTPHEPLSPGD